MGEAAELPNGIFNAYYGDIMTGAIMGSLCGIAVGLFIGKRLFERLAVTAAVPDDKC